MKLPHIFLAVFLLILLVACGNSDQETNVLLTNTPLITVIPSGTPFPTLPLAPTFTVAPTKAITLTPTLNPTQQTWLSTAVVIKGTQNAINQLKRDSEANLIAQFPNKCENTYYYYLSPDAKWLAINCGNENAKTLKLQNREDVIWTVEYTDLFGTDAWDGESSSIKPIFWDLVGNYVYITSTFGGSGGGNFCFPGYGTNGLFRLDLKTGLWVTLVPPRFFPGNEIKYSPTGRRYAVDINGITINDLQTGEVIQINVSGVMGLIWSPDGTKLAYSISRCNEEGFVIDSSLYVWDALENESQLILKTEKALLYPDSWDDISRLDISSEQYMPEINNTTYDLYEYDITHDELIFIGPDPILP